MNYNKTLLFFGTVAIVFFLVIIYANNIFYSPSNVTNKELVLIEIKKGMGLSDISLLLSKKGIINHPYLFNTQIILRGSSSHLKVGIYELSPSMTQNRVYRTLLAGNVATRTITIPEGFTVKMIGEKLEKNGITNKKDIIRLSGKKEFILSLGLKTHSLEGYLFPDTYILRVKMHPELVLKKMIQNFRKKMTSEIRLKIQKQKKTLHEVLTLASIVEKETSVPKERFLIASVFLNRLKKNMRLQSDPTVIYSLPFLKRKLSKKDLSYNSPYNTYIRRGLPPGPIANPGIESILAVLNPSKKTFLYFVAKGDSSHFFSKTYKEHRRNIRFIKKQRLRKVDLNYGTVSSSK
tara:strand:+ start:5050 stop:6096 length:1047 start_codon:yes stop_codon:yes gene_type:complete